MATPTYDCSSELLRALIFFPIDLCCLLMTFWLVDARLDFLAHAQSVEGCVSSLNAGSRHPQIDFVDATGKAHSYPENGLINGYAVGDTVTVLYRAEAPSSSAVIKDRGALWAEPVFASLFALVFIWGGVRNAISVIRTLKGHSSDRQAPYT